MNINLFLQHISNALSLGSLYALIAIGYTMVYGILRLINFAHGDVFMLGGYISFYCTTIFFMPWWAGFIVALGLTGIFGIGLERAAYKPLRSSPKISIMISAIGASFLMENLATVIFGGRPKGFTIPGIFNHSVRLGPVSVSAVSLLIPVLTAFLLAALLLIVHKTKTGMAMRALSTDLSAARLMAIDVNKIVSFTFGVGSVLAAIGGVMWATKYPQLNPNGHDARPEMLHSRCYRRYRQHIRRGAGWSSARFYRNYDDSVSSDADRLPRRVRVHHADNRFDGQTFRPAWKASN